jgi:hypothetical protein
MGSLAHGRAKKEKTMTSLVKYKIDRDNPESLVIEKEGIEVEGPVVVGKLPKTEMVFRRPVDREERFVRNRLRYLPEVEVMDPMWREICAVSRRISRAEARQRQLQRRT